MEPKKTQSSEPLVLEIVEKAHVNVESANGFVLKPVAASRAFREYSWVRGRPGLNKSGNLRGMVINKKMRTIYKVSEKVGKRLAVLGILFEVSKEMNRIERVYSSNASSTEKVSRITLLGSGAILRSITGVVPTAVEITALSVQGYAQLYSAATGSEKGNEVSDSVGAFAKQVRHIHTQQWDGENWYDVIEAVVD